MAGVLARDRRRDGPGAARRNRAGDVRGNVVRRYGRRPGGGADGVDHELIRPGDGQKRGSIKVVRMPVECVASTV